jgi:predicted ester cyclase
MTENRGVPSSSLGLAIKKGPATGGASTWPPCPMRRSLLHHVVAQGAIAAGDWTYSGTNSGEILGMPPTGRSASITGSHFFRFEGDKIAETWTWPDNLGLLQQLGLVTIGPAG